MKLNLIIFSFFALVFCGQIKSQTACGDDVFTLFQKSHIRDFEKIEKANNLQIKNYIDSHYGSSSTARSAASTVNM